MDKPKYDKDVRNAKKFLLKPLEDTGVDLIKNNMRILKK
jgi:hypothetical protein